MKNIILSLIIFRGRPTYDENGNVTSESQPMKLEHGTEQYKQFLASALNLGFTKIKIVKATQGFKDGQPIQVEVPKDIEQEIINCVKVGGASAPSDKDTIKALQDRLAKLEAKEEEEKGSKNSNDDEIDEVRKEYFELFNETPDNRLGIKKMKERIAEKKAETEE